MIKCCKMMFLQLKSAITSPSFLMLILIMILALGATDRYVNSHKTELVIPIDTRDYEVGAEVTRMLLASNEQGISFIELDEEDIAEGILNGRYPCGLIFNEGMTDVVKSGNNIGAITILSSSDSVDALMIKEVVFPYILRCVSDDMLLTYINSDEVISAEEGMKLVAEKSATLSGRNELHLYDTVIIEGKTEKEVDLRRMVFIAVLVILLMVNLVDVGIACKDYLAAHRKIEKAFLLISGAFGRTVILTMVGLAVYAVKLMD